jgi:hypothetical protein
MEQAGRGHISPVSTRPTIPSLTSLTTSASSLLPFVFAPPGLIWDWPLYYYYYFVFLAHPQPITLSMS